MNRLELDILHARLKPSEALYVTEILDDAIVFARAFSVRHYQKLAVSIEKNVAGQIVVRSTKGFTLIETTIALAVFVVLAAISLPLLARDRTADRILNDVDRVERRVATDCSIRAYVESLPTDVAHRVDVPAGWTLAIRGAAPIGCRGIMTPHAPGQRFLHYTSSATSPEGVVTTRWR